MRRAQCPNADLSSDIRARPIWSNTISEVDLITKNSLVDWQKCNNWRGGCSWELENSKVACATLSIPYDSTKLMQGTQYPTSNLVMPQVYQMITKLEMSTMTYVHTSRKESISIDEALQKAVRPDMMKRILKARTQMVESMYKYFDSDLSESHRAKLYICTLLDPRFKHYNWWPTRKYVQNAPVMHSVYIVL